ncbi:hypothetical protein BGW36DRAFT_310987 [Talaromyces proteolyticus]|uniref:Uncharacterized protein n=1 Tax=Talaromyces proteolyticus TaxID=1131652 RepID=A0AAD4L3T8_9EURO|nr:uncharacterized protein BGW36DRAFT_310987 [Talaromyces proteolyticus]KAH8705427.1 hypothetical protein BGW36DRAFT_310987 [Talaromyces proteolyticus]
MSPQLKILTPIGMLGYSYNKETFWAAVEAGVDAIILDSGSTDSGPSKLALRKSIQTNEAYKKDLEDIVAACHYHRTPVLIGEKSQKFEVAESNFFKGSAGGDGSTRGVNQIGDIIQSVIERGGYRSMKVIKILAEIEKDVIREKHRRGMIRPCGISVPDLVEEDINEARTIVAQMGVEPWIKAMNDHPDFDIMIGGRSYDPSPYAAFCAWKGFPDLGISYHMGKIMECGGLCTSPKSREALATVRHDYFDITPLDPESVCTSTSVAAHTLYEKTRPDVLVGPGGTLDLHSTTYEELEDGRSVRVRGAKFIPVKDNEYTIKLEAGKLDGFFSIFMGGFRDAVLISQIDKFLEAMKTYVAQKIDFPFDINVQLFGRDAVMGALEPNSGQTGHELGILLRARAETQDQATHVCQSARVYCMHAPYPGQRASAGNFAMPCAPLDIPMGPVSEFCMYHLMTVSDPCENFPITAIVMEGSNTAPQRDSSGVDVQVVVNRHATATNGGIQTKSAKSTVTTSVLGREPPTGHKFLADLASVVRSKNSGPYELTFDVMFSTEQSRDIVKNAKILTAEKISTLYNVPVSDVIACLWWDPAIAFKATIKRSIVSGSFHDSDAHGSAQHMPFMELPIPVGNIAI